MPTSIPTPRRPLATSRGNARPSLAQRLQRWLLAGWHSLCAQAERPTRRVPRY